MPCPCRPWSLEDFGAASAPTLVEDGIAFAREAAAAGTVLLRNEGELPWDAPAPASVAVIGHNAKFARSQGGGSATVLPKHVVSPLEGVCAALPDSRISYSVGAVVQEGVAELPLESITNPATGEPGLRARFLAADGTELFSEDRRATALVWFGGMAPIVESSVLELTTRYLPEESGSILLGFASTGRARIYVDGTLLLDDTIVAESSDLGAAFLSPPTSSAPVAVVEGVAIDIRIEYMIVKPEGELSNVMSFTFGIEPDDSNPERLIAEAVEAARGADVALVVVGTNSRVESEGYDRSSLALPGRQDDLVRAVAAANPRTVVVVNAGAPVLMPWRNDVAAVVVGYFGGEQFGNAIADVLLGRVEPGGRLPTTWPANEADVPVIDTTPVDGVLRYDEGIHIGYRAWLKSGATPAYPFGHGLGYTEFSLAKASAPSIVAPGATVSVGVEVTNEGSRAGKAVVQVYAERADSTVDRPVRWLVGFQPAIVAAGETKQVHVDVSTRLLAYWNDGWTYEPGSFVLRVGTSVVDLPLVTAVELSA
jgi:beta-glucosidase